MTDRLFRLWMTGKSELTPHTITLLLERFGDPAHIYAAGCEELLTCEFLKKAQVDQLCDKELGGAETLLRACERQRVAVLTPEDRAYPSLLRGISDPPAVLYVRGTLPDFDRAPGVAIVGTRECTPYGLSQAEKFGAALAEAGFTVVSGMARGVDSAANRGALRAGKPTVAVLAGGVDICYPPSNRRLMGDILLEGAVISENPPGTDSAGFRFPIRNRIISGLCAAALVVEAPTRSGALITARTALDQGREVFALPGNVDAPTSRGCNALIRDGAAAIATEPLDLVHALSGLLRTLPDEDRVREIYRRESGGMEPPAEQPEKPAPPAKRERKTPKAEEKPAFRMTVSELLARPRAKVALEELAGDERLVAEAIRDGASTQDAIIEKTGLSAHRALSALTMLEIDGVVRGTPAGVSLA